MSQHEPKRLEEYYEDMSMSWRLFSEDLRSLPSSEITQAHIQPQLVKYIKTIRPFISRNISIDDGKGEHQIFSSAEGVRLARADTLLWHEESTGIKYHGDSWRKDNKFFATYLANRRRTQPWINVEKDIALHGLANLQYDIRALIYDKPYVELHPEKYMKWRKTKALSSFILSTANSAQLNPLSLLSPTRYSHNSSNRR